jgi:hypothetical protein
MTAEHLRLEAARHASVPWKSWGPYLSERQWGTVREDYSEGGDAWNYFTHDQARSPAYLWRSPRQLRSPPRSRCRSYRARHDRRISIEIVHPQNVPMRRCLECGCPE